MAHKMVFSSSLPEGRGNAVTFRRRSRRSRRSRRELHLPVKVFYLLMKLGKIFRQCYFLDALSVGDHRFCKGQGQGQGHWGQWSK